MRKLLTLREAFEECFEKRGESECWTWPRVYAQGYGYLSWYGRRQGAHRWAYEIYVGPIPDGLTIDHLCRNRACVNPAHLEAVTRGENSRRCHLVHTHCPNGHEFTEENSRHYPMSGYRFCTICHPTWAQKPSKPRGYLQKFCKNGHRRTAENTYVYKGRRRCRLCEQARYLKPGGYAERGSRFSRETHCPNGHEWTAENTYLFRDKYRRCRACGREAKRGN